ncbi:hypothetical protein PF005_g17157 [Phytophthora fragariae]|uniref:EF-hand domain-containing protein n=1 Tax=Phytophthora fragariae TaxID=53985 RepID=A0A6A3T379_9STRA|nr:hypothetical protein PF003_g14505 [Phytophthora fragariae]KAE8931567.1 hypothetical protein PF009_g18372 [Phytophthora fragariae]KAE9095662.1 hypothetical protein PF007_g17293 [Phytophthora fragariae]KAE9128385.1 hypothetical protein PF006_g16297 [Phytophthora fragariae]KAE9195757.1 hypothetical protein PF005_g17157 [Phytophthora fragariae]
MAAAFYWETEAFRVAMAPWSSDPSRQRAVSARVSVAEQWTPGFALRFDLEILEKPVENAAEMGSVLTPTHCSGHLMRLVNQRQMLRAFEFAFVGLEADQRRPPGGEEGGDELLDRKLKKWLAGGGQVPAPPKEELARWLLAWMIVAPATESEESADEWVVLMCGEKGAECSVELDLFTGESGDSSEPVVDDGKDNGAVDDDSGRDTEDDEELPPPYEEVEVVEADASTPDPATCEDVARPAEVPIQGKESSRDRDILPKQPAKRKLSVRSSSTRSLAISVASTTSTEQNEKPLLKPTIVRLNPRLDSLDVVNLEEPSDEWSEDRRHFQQELRASRRDVLAAKQQREKVERLAQLRHTQLLKESARKLRVNEQKRRDAQAVRQLIADTLEYRDELSIMESKVKQASIAALRDQERVKRQTRVVLGNTEKATRGSVIGPGPLSKKEIELIASNTRDEAAVYDLHGRRHSLEEAKLVAKESALESAMRKIRRLLLYSSESVDIFRRYDIDRSGALSYNEFQRMLRENGTGDPAELTKEQSMAFFTRFDADNSGEIDYSELLWGFFNWEAFLKRWHERKSASTTAPSEREMRPFFLKYDRSSQGVVTIKQFQLVMDYLDVILSDVDAKLLAVKFDAGKDGYIDYNKFLSCVNLSETQHDVNLGDGNQSLQSTVEPRSCPDTAPPGMERIWKELQTLTTTQAKLHRLLRK